MWFFVEMGLYSPVPRGFPTPHRCLQNGVTTHCTGHSYTKTFVVYLNSYVAGPPVTVAAKSGSPNSNPRLGARPKVAQEDEGLGLPWKPLKTAGNSGSFRRSKLCFDSPSSSSTPAPPRQLPCEFCGKLVLRAGSTGHTGGNDSRSN